MRIAVCCPSSAETDRICQTMTALAAEKSRSAEIVPFSSEEALRAAFGPGSFTGALVGLGDVSGFLCARRLREEDPACRVILLDDTDRYAIRGLRIHLTDYLVRPVEEPRLRSALERLLAD